MNCSASTVEAFIAYLLSRVEERVGITTSVSEEVSAPPTKKQKILCKVHVPQNDSFSDKEYKEYKRQMVMEELYEENMAYNDFQEYMEGERVREEMEMDSACHCCD